MKNLLKKGLAVILTGVVLLSCIMPVAAKTKTAKNETAKNVSSSYSAPKITSIKRSHTNLTIKYLPAGGEDLDDADYELYMATSKNGKYKWQNYNFHSEPNYFKEYYLTRGKTYYFKIKATIYDSNYDETIKWSGIKAIKIPKLKKPTKLKISKKKKTSAVVSWKKVKEAKAYEIYVSQGKGKFYYWGSTKKNKFKMTYLNKRTNYRVKVRAYDTDYRNGPFSKAKKFKTK